MKSLLLACVATLAFAQSATVFKTHLATVAMDATMRATVAGSGSASASLLSAKLTITGKFEGLVTPATAAQIRLSPVTGVRGPVIFEVPLDKAVSGTISGAVNLTPDQIEKLRKGCFYLQINSEKAPDGNLWGWFLP